MGDDFRRRSLGASPVNPYGRISTPPKSADIFRDDGDAFFTPAAVKPFFRNKIASNRRATIGASECHANARVTDVAPVVDPASDEEINRWFASLIAGRKRLAAFWSGVSFAFLYLVLLICLQFSPWFPIVSLTNIFWSTTSLSFYGLVVTAGVSFGVAAWTVNSFLSKVDQTRHVSLFKTENWIAFSVILGANLVLYLLALNRFFDRNLIYNKGIFYSVFFLGTVVSTGRTIFEQDFRLLFCAHGIMKKFALSSDQLEILQTSFQEGVKTAAFSTITILILGIFMNDIGCFWLLFNISALYALIFVFSLQMLNGNLLNRFCRQIAMEAIDFDFPPPHAIVDPTPEDHHNILVALNTSNPFLKLFAVFNVRSLGRYDMKNRRSDVFALSKPAGHPRNWSNIRSVCLSVLTNLRGKIEEACCQMKGEEFKGLDKSGNQEDLDKEVLMMPPKARKRLGADFTVRNPNIDSKNVSVASLYENLKKLFFFSPVSGLISTLEADLVCYSIEALSQLVLFSVEEDRYGVVQKDIPVIVLVFTQLYAAIDKYFREKAFLTDVLVDDRALAAVQNSTATAVSRLSRKFQRHTGNFDLPEVERSVYMDIIRSCD